MLDAVVRPVRVDIEPAEDGGVQRPPAVPTDSLRDQVVLLTVGRRERGPHPYRRFDPVVEQPGVPAVRARADAVANTTGLVSRWALDPRRDPSRGRIRDRPALEP